MKTHSFHLTWPQITLDTGRWPLTSLNIWKNPNYIFDPGLVVIRFQLFKLDSNENLTKLEHTYTPLHIYGVKHGPCFSLSEDTQAWLSLVHEDKMANCFCKISFLHMNMTYHTSMGTWYFKRKRGCISQTQFYIMLESFLISDDRSWWRYDHGIKVEIHVGVLVW